MEPLRLATVWLGGCSGCHMALLDLDAWLIDLADQVQLVYGPLTDAKEFPSDVDLVLVEGAVANVEHHELLQTIRARSRVLVAFGNCAHRGSITALRNPLGDALPLLNQVYGPGADLPGQVARGDGVVPVLLPQVESVSQVVTVDVALAGCPPPTARIRALLEAQIAHRREVV